MKRFFARPCRRAFRSGGPRRAGAFTLVETMVSLAVLVVISTSSMYSFMLLNRYASNLRNLSAAKELCQERIEQVSTMPFTPPATAPLVPGQDGNYYYILGMPTVLPTIPAGVTTVPASSPQTASDYSAAGAFTGKSNQTTLSELVTINAPADGTTNSAITGTRTTTIALSPIADYTQLIYGSTTQSLNLIQFTVTVSYTFRGQTYSYSMYTLRGPD